LLSLNHASSPTFPVSMWATNTKSWFKRLNGGMCGMLSLHLGADYTRMLSLIKLMTLKIQDVWIFLHLYTALMKFFLQLKTDLKVRLITISINISTGLRPAKKPLWKLWILFGWLPSDSPGSPS
jgi:hypothetical protein